ncbi:MAG: C40 family peptidase [Planctomycetes bacterium]|nr:C40 family peptidase [Planctomycetota bacterium]
MPIHRIAWIVLLSSAIVVPTLPADDTKREDYKSPYSVKFSHPLKELVGDLDGPRGDPHLESDVPFREWNTDASRKKFETWGPPQRHYPEPEGIANKSREWKQQRVIAVALRFQGYGYNHHHIPDWLPPDTAKKTGHNSKGVDCSNFTTFVYNLGFGIKPNSDVHKQSEEREFPLPGEKRQHKVELISKLGTYKELVDKLQTGDLLYIRNVKGEIAHVVIWVGSIGQPDKTPLIIDSHGDSVKDSEGNQIPNGIHLRPFIEKSWYYHSASHALRVFPEK